MSVTSGPLFSACIGLSVKPILAEPDSPDVPRFERAIDELVYPQSP